MVGIIHNEQVAGEVRGLASSVAQFLIGRRAPVAGVTRCPVARHRGNDPVGSNLADTIIIFITKEKVASSVHRHAHGSIQCCIGCRAPIPTKITGCIAARKRGDNPIGSHLADAIVRPISNE